MRVDLILQGLRENPDRACLRRTARALGDEMPRNRIEVMAKFRAGQARILLSDDFGRGYLQALADVCRAYETAIRKQEELQELAQLVKNQPSWPKIGVLHYDWLLKELEERPCTAKELSEMALKFLRNVSYNCEEVDMQGCLHNLQGLHLVDGLKGKYYRLTLLGQDVMRVLNG